jgi:CheY-like chemotaxis protein
MLKRVLVLNDSKEARRVLVDSITRNFPEIEIVQAANGLEAKDKLLECSGWVAAILDFVVLGLNGLEVARLIRQQEETKNILIVIISGFANHSAKFRERAKGLSCLTMGVLKPGDICQQLSAVLK